MEGILNIKNFEDWIKYGQYKRWFLIKDIETIYKNLILSEKINNYIEVRNLIKRIFKYNVNNLRDDEIRNYINEHAIQYIHYQQLLITFIPISIYLVYRKYQEKNKYITEGVFYCILCDFNIDNIKYNIEELPENFNEIFNKLYEMNNSNHIINKDYYKEIKKFINTWMGYIENEYEALIYILEDLKVGNNLIREIEEMEQIEDIINIVNKYFDKKINEDSIEFINDINSEVSKSEEIYDSDSISLSD